MSIINVEGKILIATPKITNKVFYKSVIYVHTDNETGSSGILLNVPMDSDIAIQWSQEIDWHHPDRVFHGGPVERQLGYIIHTSDYARENTVQLNDNLSYTNGGSIVDDINRGVGPYNYILLTGYCAWQLKQLDIEIKNGMWSVVDFDPDYFFKDLDRAHGWEFSINVAAENKTAELLDMVDTA